jgi:hypothetical protein
LRLGHATVAITLDTYSHVLPAHDQAAADFIGRSLDGAGQALPRESVTTPAGSAALSQVIVVLPLGLEPRTNGLRVHCSAN